MANPLLELQALGQSIWLDFISRQLITTGQLKRMIDEDGLRGAVFEIMTKQLGHRPSEAAQLISTALGRNPRITTPEELFDEIYRGAKP